MFVVDQREPPEHRRDRPGHRVQCRDEITVSESTLYRIAALGGISEELALVGPLHARITATRGQAQLHGQAKPLER